MIEHTVRAGESLSSIAKAYGLESWQALYNAPENQTFRLKFPNPNKVSPGAKIAIPSAAPKAGAAAAEAKKQQENKTTAKSGTTASTGSLKAPAPRTDPKKPFNPDAEPDELTADIVKDTAFVFPAAFVKFLCVALKVPEADFMPALEILKKRTDGIEALILFYKSYKAFKKSSLRPAVGNLFKGVGKGWGLFPKGVRAFLVKGMYTICSRIPKFDAIANSFPILDRAEALGPCFEMMGGFIEGGKDGTKDAMAAGKSLVDALKSHPGEATMLVGPIADFLQSLIPTKLKAKLLGKMAGRKVPVVGTIVVGIMDGVSIWSDPTDWKRWAGLGSTIAGLIPGPGTAVSVLIDISILIGTLAENIHDLDIKLDKALPI